MILSIQNTTIKLIVPIYHIRLNEPTNILFIFFSVIYLILLLISGFMVYHHLFMFWTIRKFHYNLTVILCFTFGSWIEGLISVLLTWPYKAGLIGLNETGEKFDGLETDNMTVVTRTNSTYPLFVGSFLFFHYISTNCAGMVMFVLERGMASFMFNDYEKHKRGYIAILLILCTESIMVTIVSFYVFRILNLNDILAITVVNYTCTIIFMLYLLKYNIKIRNSLDLKSASLSRSYSLAARFQAAENVRSFKLAGVVVTVICSLVAITFFLILTVQLGIVPDDVNDALFWGFEATITLNPLFIAPASFYSVPEWRKAFFQKLPVFRNRVIPKKPEIRRMSTETNVYFSQLQTSWN